jgi:hypothetical protein
MYQSELISFISDQRCRLLWSPCLALHRDGRASTMLSMRSSTLGGRHGAPTPSPIGSRSKPSPLQPLRLRVARAVNSLAPRRTPLLLNRGNRG